MKTSRCRRSPSLFVTCLLISVSAASWLPLARAAEPADTIFVTPKGDDANVGSRERPVRTLIHARDLARTLKAQINGDVTIRISGGVYRLAEPLVLEPADSGVNGHAIVYAAAPGESVVISGGLAVTGWKRIDAAKNIWAAAAPAGLQNSRQLYVNGVRAQRARGRVPVALTETATGYTASSPVMASWKNPADIEFVYTGGNTVFNEHEQGLGSWTEPRCPIARIEGTTITMAQPCWDNSTKRVMLPPDHPFRRAANLVGPQSVGKQPEYVENAYELLDTPGEWYFDRAAKQIFYIPRPGEKLNRSDVEVAALEQLIVARGTAEQPVHDVVFSGLQFSYATWLFPSTPEGFSEIQANYMVTGPKGYATQGLCSLVPDGTCPYGAWTKTPGNVVVDHGVRVKFLDDTFTHLGAAGLELGHGAQDDLVRGCVFTDISANGIELGGVDRPLATGADVTRDDEISNNHIFNVGAEYHGGIGIVVGYAQRTKIVHNQLDHLPYAGISMGWGGWPDKIHQAGQANISQNNVIANNLIFQHMQLLADGGGIYTQGLTGPSLAEGEKITGNVIYSQYGSGNGIYTDNGCKNVTATGNVIFHTNHQNWGGRHKDYYDGAEGKADDAFDFENNYWEQGEPDSSVPNVTLKNNRIITALDQAPAEILKNAGLEESYKPLLKKGEPAVVPEAPSRVAVAAGDGYALVAWNPPVFQGASSVTSYTVTASSGAQTTISAADFVANGLVKVAGLKNGTEYTFTVAASNARGSSAPSLPSHPATPAVAEIKPPSAPANVKAFPGDGVATVHWQSPVAAKGSDGGSPITAFVITANPGGKRVVFTGRTVLALTERHVIFTVIDGLENGKAYTFDVAAMNAAGEGAKATTAAITPAAYSK